MITGSQYAAQAMSDKYTGIPYSKLDCQAFVEEVLKDCGVRKPDGSVYNWKGSNSMWRTALSWKGTIDQAKTKYGCIPAGSWVFIVRNDGGEKDRGYNDNEGNAAHVGIYCRDGSDPVRDSTKTSYRNGVGYRELKGFTHVGIPKMLDFEQQDISRIEAVKAVKLIRDSSCSDLDFLSAMETLTKYLFGG